MLNQLFQVTSNPKIWILQVLAILLITGIVHFIASFVWQKIEDFLDGKAALTRVILDSSLLPILIFIWLCGVSIAILLIARDVPLPLFSYTRIAGKLIFIGLIAMFGVRFVKRLEKHLTDAEQVSKPLDITTASALSQISCASIYIVAALTILQSVGYSITGALTFGGIGGLVISFAAKDMIANFLSAIVIYVEKPFRVGDWVRSPDRDVEGTVLEIGWRATRIRKFDTTPIYVPNSVLTEITIETPSLRTNRRIQESWEVRFHDWRAVPECLTDIRKMVSEHEGLAKDKPPHVNFDDFSSSGMSLWVYAFMESADWVQYLEVKESIYLNIIRILHEHNAEMALPVQKIEIAERQENSTSK